MKKLWVILSLAFLIIPSLSNGAEPIDNLREAIDQVLIILNDPKSYDESGKDRGREKIQVIINRIFDFREMSRITLARNWSRFSEQEKNEFSKVFSEFLTANYLGKIQTDFEGEKVIYLDQEKSSPTKSLVRTKVIRKSGEIPVDYRMILREGMWRVYDIRIEGVSMMKNYYVQFREILHKDPPSHLIELLKNKTRSQG